MKNPNVDPNENPVSYEKTKFPRKTVAGLLAAAALFGFSKITPAEGSDNPVSGRIETIREHLPGADQSESIPIGDPFPLRFGMRDKDGNVLDTGGELADYYLRKTVGEDRYGDADVLQLGQIIHDAGRGEKDAADVGAKLFIVEYEDGTRSIIGPESSD